MRITRNVIDVLEVLGTPNQEWWGLEIASVAGIPTPTVYGVLARLERAGCVEGRFEHIDPARAGRPPRRLYNLTPDGAEFARRAVADWNGRRRRGGLKEQLG